MQSASPPGATSSTSNTTAASKPRKPTTSATCACQRRNTRCEKLATLAWLQGSAYPNDILTENWKKITFNQFHDLAAGSGIAVIYRDAQSDYTEVSNADKEIALASRKTLDAGIDTRVKIGVPVVVNNTLGWPRVLTTEFESTTRRPPPIAVYNSVNEERATFTNRRSQ